MTRAIILFILAVALACISVYVIVKPEFDRAACERHVGATYRPLTGECVTYVRITRKGVLL